MNEFESFHFLRPHFFWLFLPVSLLFLALFKMRQKSLNPWQQYIDAQLLSFLATQASKKNNRLFGLLFLGMLLGIVALAGPAYQKVPQQAEEQKNATVIVLDASLSMGAQDLSPNRFERAKYKILDYIKVNPSESVGLVVYAADGYVVSPLTDDVHTIEALIPMMDLNMMPDFGSDVVKGIEKAIQLLTQAHIRQGKVLLMTDGIRTNQIKPIESIFKQQPYRLLVLGIGTEAGAPIPIPEGGFAKNNHGEVITTAREEKNLKKIASLTRGLYEGIHPRDKDILNLSQSALQMPTQTSGEKIEVPLDQWEDLGSNLLLMLLPILALAFRRGWLGTFLVVFLIHYPTPSEAGEWKDWWLNQNQQGLQLLEEKKTKEAAEKFIDPAWKASSFYLAEQYSQAQEWFAKVETEDGFYNQGNALAKQGNMEAAINAYTQALKMNPQHEDAQYNKQLLENYLREKNSQNSGNQQQKPDPNQSAQNKKESTENKDPSQNNKDPSQKNTEPSENSSSNPQNEPQSAQDSSAGQQETDSSSAKNAQKNPSSDQANGQQTEPNEQAEPEEKSSNPNQPSDSHQGSPTPDQLMASKEGDGESPLETQPDDKIQRDLLKNKQILNHVPDDPSGLLRRKFYLQSQQKNGQSNEPTYW